MLALQSAAVGLPSCVLKQVKAQEILNYSEALNNISKTMRKGQLKAMLQGVSKRKEACRWTNCDDHCCFSRKFKANIVDIHICKTIYVFFNVK